MLAFNSAIRRGDADLPHGKGEANSLPRGTLSETPAPSRSGNSSLPPPPQPIGLREAAGRGPAPRGGGVGGGGGGRAPAAEAPTRPTADAAGPLPTSPARSPQPAPCPPHSLTSVVVVLLLLGRHAPRQEGDLGQPQQQHQHPQPSRPHPAAPQPAPLRSGPPCPLPACLPAALRRGAAADRLARRSEAAPPRKARARATNGSRAASRAPPPSSRNRFAAAGDERDRPKRRAHAPPCAKLDACSEVPLPHWLPGLHQPPVATRFRRSRPGSGGGGGGERWRGGREAGLPPPRARSHIALRDWRAAASGRAQGGAGEGTGRCQRAVAACEEAPRARGGVGLVSRGGVAWRGVGVPLVARGRPGGR